MKGKYILNLDNFCSEKCLVKYGIWEDKQEYEIIEDIYEDSVINIMDDDSPKYMLFLDAKKNKVKFWINMYDYTKDGPLPQYTNMPCWWCRDTFLTSPLGIPIRYFSLLDQNTIEYEYIMKKCKHLNIKNVEEFFETEGIMCSFPCMKAYILKNMNNPRYKNSLDNLSLLMKKLSGKFSECPTAPSWKLIDTWGGHMTIEKFRSSFGHFVYEESINMVKPYMFPISSLNQEIKL